MTTIRFLDRYVFKNPKKLDEKKVSKSNDPLAVRAKYTPKGMRSIPVDSLAYLNEDERKIPVDELFLYKYLRKKNEAKTIKKEEDDDDNDSVNSEEFNDMMDKLGGNKDLEELDIAADIGSSKKKKGKSKKDELDEEEEEEEDDDDEDEGAMDENEEEEEKDDGFYNDDGDSMDDEDMEGLDDELGLDEIDDDMSDIEFNDSDDEQPTTSGKGSKAKKSKAFGRGKKGGIDSNVFVSAEEFAEMLEEQGRTKGKQGGSHALSDADGAGAKQLDWEIGRHQKIEGKFRGKKRPFGNKGFKGNKNSKKSKR